jgi:DNA-binding NtrC family response regulator
MAKMEKKIIVLDAEPAERQWICALLAEQNYLVAAVQSLSDLKERLESEAYMAVIINIDSVPLDNRSIRNLVLEFPGTCILCTSKDRFHPDLKDAICYHIYACLNKPVDPDELFYWLRSIRENDSN